MTIVSPLLTFPNIGWWMRVVDADVVIFDTAEHFQKMSYRNRYRISGSNNSILLTVPITNGRDQRRPMKEVQVFNKERWQVQHWRTLVSVYRRTPYFEHYERELSGFFEREYESLVTFNKAGIDWVKQQLGLRFEEQYADSYIREYPVEITDLRVDKDTDTVFPIYYQVFEDRTGFMPDLSILDLLFSEGPGTVDKLKGQ